MNKEHHFTIEDAVSYGIEKAILLYNIRFWLDKNKANNKNIYINPSDQRLYHWTYNSSTAFAELFPYMNPKSISKWLLELEKDGVLISSKFNKKGYDRTKWYTSPTYLSIAPTEQSNAPGEQPIPDNKQQIVNTYIPIVSDVPSEPIVEDLVKPNQEKDQRLLPVDFGRAPLERLAAIYKNLWRDKYGSLPTAFNYGRFGKTMKQLLVSFTEIQVAILMDCYFDWMGITGDNQKDNDFLIGNGFSVELMAQRVDIYYAYLKNVMGVKMDDVDSARAYAKKVLKIKRII